MSDDQQTPENQPPGGGTVPPIVHPLSTQHATRSTSYFRRAVRLRCPVCGEGRLFAGWTMHDRCPACGFAFEREPGYWTNAVTLNFMTTGGAAMLLVGPLVYSGLPVLAVIALGMLLAVVLPLLCFRHCKAFWLAIDLRIRPPTTFERLDGFLHVTRRGDH